MINGRTCEQARFKLWRIWYLIYVRVGFVYVVSLLWIYVLGHHLEVIFCRIMNDKGNNKAIEEHHATLERID
jgi:hypothetical protein